MASQRSQRRDKIIALWWSPCLYRSKENLEIDTATLKVDIEELFDLFGVKAKRVCLNKEGKHYKSACIDYTLSVVGREKALTFFSSFYNLIYEDGYLVDMEKNPNFLGG